MLQVTGRNELEEIEDFVTRARASSPGEIKAGKFSREIGRFLDQARMQKRYDRLFLIAPPRFLGLIRKELGKEGQQLVRDEIDKDLSWLDAREIHRFLKGNGTSAKYP